MTMDHRDRPGSGHLMPPIHYMLPHPTQVPEVHSNQTKQESLVLGFIFTFSKMHRTVPTQSRTRKA